MLAARTVGGLRDTFGTEASSPDASRLFLHFSQPLATAFAASVEMDDAGEGSHGNRSHAAKQSLEALVGLTRMFRGSASLAARLLGRSGSAARVPHKHFERLEDLLRQLEVTREGSRTAGCASLHVHISDILSCV